MNKILRSFSLALLAILAPVGGTAALADKTPTQQLVEQAEAHAEAAWRMPRGRLRMLGSSFYERYARFNSRLWERQRLLYLVAPTLMTQAGTQGGPDDFTANEQVMTVLAWQFLRSRSAGDSTFVLNHLHLGQITSTTGVDFTRSLGINFFPSDSVGEADVFKAVAVQHNLPNDMASFFAGHTLAAEVDGGGRFTVDDTTSFISQPLSGNPARQMPGAGIGFGFDAKISKRWTVQAHVADGRGDGTLATSAREFGNGDLVVVGALQLENPFPQHGEGWYKASAYWVSETQAGTPDAKPEGWGLHLQAEQDFGDFGVFAKFGMAAGRTGFVDRYGTTGVVWQRPFGCSEDWLALGFGAVHPTAASTNLEYVAEAFWRVQLTPFLTLTPDVQLVFNPSYRPETDVEAIFTCRLRLQL